MTSKQQQNSTTQPPNKSALTDGNLPEMVSPYMQNLIKNTGGANGPIGLQFISKPRLEQKFYSTAKSDPLIESKNEQAPGIIYKYKGKIDRQNQVEFYGRVLWTITRFCATYCRFCTRGRFVGIQANRNQSNGEILKQRPYLTPDDIQKSIAFIKNHPEINEVILSGGDPLVVPEKYLQMIVSELINLQNAHQIDFIRFHTRAPITNPFLLQPWHYQILSQIINPYIVLHINHPAELTPEVLEVIKKLKQTGAKLLSQSVLLKGVNDDVSTLQKLFIKLTKNGIQPYYLHQNDPVYWAEHFTVPIKRAIKIWHQLRPRLSGIVATAKFVIDTPYGYGKVPIPEGGWDFDESHFKDFHGKKHQLIN